MARPPSFTGQSGPLAPEDIQRPGIAADPGVRMRSSPVQLTAATDKTGGALSGFGKELSGVAKVWTDLYDKRRDAEDKVFLDRYQIEIAKRFTPMELGAVNSPEASRPDFVQSFDKRLDETAQTTFDELTADGQFSPSEKGRQAALHAAAQLRIQAARRTAINAHNQQLVSRVDTITNNVTEISRIAAQNGDVAGNLERVDSTLEALRGVLAADKWEAMRKSAREQVVESAARGFIERGDPDRAYSILDRNRGFASNEVERKIAAAAGKQSQDPAYLVALARLESSGDPAAKPMPDAQTGVATSAAGLFQFTKGTGRQYGLPSDASTATVEQQAEAAARFTADNQAALKSALGRDPNPGELYLAHFLGTADAVKVLKAEPDRAIGDIIAEKSFAANRTLLKDKTASGLMDWAQARILAAGGGGAANYLSEQNRIRLLRETDTKSHELERKRKETQALETYTVQRLIKDDLASLRDTGYGASDLPAERVEAALGADKAAEWQRQRGEAHSIYLATNDLPSLNEEQIGLRLQSWQPQPGEKNYATRQAVYSALTEKVDELRKLRMEDPARSVASSPTVRAALTNFDEKNPKAWQDLANARLAAQEAAGIEDASPITRQEALALTVPLRRMLPGQEKETLTEIAQAMQERFGDNADLAFSYALRAHKVEAQTAQQAARILKRIIRGDAVTTADARGFDQSTEIASAERAVKATEAPRSAASFIAPGAVAGGMLSDMGDVPPAVTATPKPAEPETKTPPARAIMALRENPSLSADFDKKYGKGTAKKILETYPIR